MMSFFKNLFKKSAPETPTRELNHVSKLIIGDIIEFSDSFTLPTEVRRQKFEVIAVETLEFEHQHYPRFKLQGEQQTYVWLSLPGHDQNNFQLSLELTREDVSQLFDLELFSDVFEEGFTELSTEQPVSLGDWHADHYYQQDIATVGYHHRTDFRTAAPSKYADENPGQQFEFYHLHDAKESKLIDIMVLNNGDTDVYLTVQLGNDSITGYWPIA
ncbi:hypothetical protein [Moritella viscosa]|nr:hypothetical protein [Moritella viscosa]